MTNSKNNKKKKKDANDGRFELRISGSGGQGAILAAILFAQASGKNPKYNVVQTQSYGPEARGGASRADVVISTNEIYYPKTMKLDLLMAFTQEACDKYFIDLKPGGLLIVDSNLVTKVPTKNSYGFPFVRMAREQIGIAMVANVIALGVIVELTGLISHEDMKAVIMERAPKGTEEKNLKALNLGFDLAKKTKRK
ncbi:MAG: 2-oxoacid:acceptor oxidoreductase family protein [candidate division Zixibacteria bacterium]|nr:2-oxoacid:acceptor oxidoreductase family protein [candidate division Zixibacteria bacterium]